MPPGTLTVASYNLYLGADLTALFGGLAEGSGPQGVARRTAAVWSAVEASRPVERMRAAAAVLARHRPDVLAVQEAALWRAGTAGCTRVHDLLDGLLNGLRRAGCEYRVAAVVDTFGSDDLTPAVAATTGQVVEFLDRCALLVRADAPLTVQRADTGAFDAAMSASVLGHDLRVRRGWCAVSLNTAVGPVRVAGTHLEAWDAAVRTAQAGELVRLLAAPSASRAPRGAVLVLGDLNCRAPQDRPAAGDPRPGAETDGDAYETLLDAGLADAWTLAPPTVTPPVSVVRADVRPSRRPDAGPAPTPGATWGQAPDLRNADPTLTDRIDHVLLDRRHLAVTAAEVAGGAPGDRTASGLWPSDHACPVVTLTAATH